MSDLHLIGIGVQHVKTGGEDSFVKAVQQIRDQGRGAAEQVTALDRAIADMGGKVGGAGQVLSAIGKALQDLARSGPESADGLSAVNRTVKDGRERALEYIKAAQEVNATLLRNIDAERSGAEAVAQRNRELLQAQALAQAGVEAESELGAAVLKEVAIWEQLQAQLALVRKEREAEEAEAAKQAAAEERLNAVLSQTRAKTATTQAATSAERQGPEAVTANNRALEERNALLKAGVALIDAQGQLVITSQEGAAAVREEVAALQAAEAELAAVKVANEAAAEGSVLWRGLASVLGEIGQALKYMVLYGGLISIAQGLKEAVEQAVKLEESLTRLKTLVGLNAQEVEGFRKSIRDISLETGQSQDDNAKALFAITSSGLRGEQALKALQASAEGAAIGLGDQTTVARAAVSAMTAYGAQNLQAKEALDVLIATAREGNTSVDDLAGAFGRVTGIAAAVGVKFGDLGAAIASMTRLGVSADEAVTGLRGTLSALELKNAKGAETALKSVGFSVAQLRAEIQEKGLAPALVDLVQKFDGNNDALAQVIPNVRALSEVLSNAKSQAGEYVGIQERVNASIGHATDEAVKLIENDPSHVFAQMRAAIGDVSLELVSGLLPSLVDLSREIKAAVEAGDVQAWAKGISVAFDVIVVAGRLFIGILGLLGPLLVAYAVWSIAAGTATTALGTAAEWTATQLTALDEAVAANPLGALAVAAVALETILSRLIDRQREMDQAWLDENAKINQTAVSLAGLRNEYIRVYEARTKGQMGPPQPVTGPAASQASGMFGSSHIELSENEGTFLGQLKKINETYEQGVKAAGDNAEGVKLATMARDRDTASLQAHYRAYLDDIQGAIASTQAQIAQRQAALANAQSQIDELSKKTAGQKFGTGGPAGDGALSADLAALKQARTDVQTYRNEITNLSATVKTSQEVHDQLATAIDKSRIAQEQSGHTTEKVSRSVENFHLDIAKQIAVREQEIKSAKDMAAAELQGGEAVAKATTLAKENKAVVEAQQKAIKDHTILRKDEEAAIRSGIEALDRENQNVQINKALHASALQTQREQLAGWAKMVDALSNTTSASARMAAVLQVEAQAESLGIPVSDDRIKQLKDEALARVDLNEQVQIAVSEAEQDRQFKTDLRDAEAAYADAVDRTTASVREAAIQKKIELALKAAQLPTDRALTDEEQKRADVIASTVRAQQDDINRTKDRTTAQLALNDALKAQEQARVSVADDRARLSIEVQYGSAVADLAVKLGAASQASRQLAALEAARATAAKQSIKEGGEGWAEILANAQKYQGELAKISLDEAKLRATAEVFKPINDAWQGVLQTGLDALSQWVETGHISMKEIASSLLKLMLQTFEQILTNWIQLQLAMKAAQSTADLGAGVATGGGLGGVVGGSGQAAALVSSASALTTSAGTLASAGAALNTAAASLTAASGTSSTALVGSATTLGASSTTAATATVNAAGAVTAAGQGSATALTGAATALDGSAAALNAAATTSATGSTVSGVAGGGSAALGSGFSAWGTYAAYGFLAWVGYKIFEGWTSARIHTGSASIGGGVSGDIGLSSAAQKVIQQLTQEVQAFADQLHLGLVKLVSGSVTVKVQSDGEIIVSTLLDPFGKVFTSMSDALDYAKAQALKFATLSGEVNGVIAAAIHNTNPSSTQDLQSTVDTANRLLQDSLSQISQQVTGWVQQFSQDIRDALRLLGPSANRFSTADFSQLVTTVNGLITNFGANLWGLYDQLTGHKEDIHQQQEMQRQAFNAQRAIWIAQIELLIEETKVRIADYQATQLFLHGGSHGGGGGLEPGHGGSGSAGASNDNPGGDPFSKEAAAKPPAPAPDPRNPYNDPGLAALLQVLDNLTRALQGLPPEIQPGGVHAGGGGGGKGGAAADAISNLKSMIDDVNKAARQSGMTDFQKQLDDWMTEFNKATAAAHLNSNAMADATRRHQQALANAHGDPALIKKANDEYAKEQTRIKKSADLLAEANAAREKELELLKKDLDGRLKEFVSKGKPGADVTDALTSIDTTAQGLIGDARALEKQGGMTTQQLHQMVASINAATAAQKAAVKDGVLASVDDFLGGKGHTGLLGNLKGISDTAKGLTDNLKALTDAGLLTQNELGALTDKIVEEAKRQQDAAINSTSQGLLSDLYGYLHMDHEAAVQKYNITIAELDARRAELAAAMVTAHYTQEAMDAILAPIDGLIQKVKDAGPSLFESKDNSSSADNGNAIADRQQQLDQLMQQLQQYEDLALSPAERQLKQLNDTFAQMRQSALALGVDLARVQRAQEIAIRDFWTQQLQNIKQLRDSLTLGQYSPLTGQARLQAAQDSFNHLAQQALAGNLDALQALPEAANTLLQEARGFFGSGAGFQDIYTMVSTILDQLLAAHPNNLSAGNTHTAVDGAGNNIVPVAPPASGNSNSASPAPTPALPPPTAVVSSGSTGGGDINSTVASLLARIEQLEKDREEAEAARETERMKLLQEIKDEQESTRKATEALVTALSGMITKLDTTMTQIVQVARR